ncbi:MAG: HAD-IIA family hydrolase [Gemmatimonadales bacterium]|nr:HAD-IIA family hydrolase [Gemmatimonadales bacterium]NIN12728.1 HAD-IIA family hydrolase [Gemmatimonadales bacterium]NIQ99619.1 HAD-IIA family hydrolase [Gemmatimonadales bacterium]NIS64176.1 HAD-IIA family hydrolase [Gemmatimonadales bacterium]
MSEAVSAFLLDLDGTLYTERGVVPGAVEAVRDLRRRGVPVRFVTNTTRRSRRMVVKRMQGYGFEVEPDEVFTAVVAGGITLTEQGIRTVAPFVAEEVLEELGNFELVGGTAGRPAASCPEAVVMGDLGDDWSPPLLTEAFRYVMDGARLIALQRGRYWLGADGLLLDAGAYVAAIEYATGKEAVVCGKPNPRFFLAAVASFGGSADRRVGGSTGDVGTQPPNRRTAEPPIVMIGDDLWADVQGAQWAGLQGWLVRTGKFRQDELQSSGIRPDRVIDSVADLSGQGE